MPWESKDIWHYMDHIAQQVPIGLLNCGCCPLHPIRLTALRESLTLIFSTINPQCLKGSFIWLTALSLQNLYLQNLHALIYIWHYIQLTDLALQKLHALLYMVFYVTDWPVIYTTGWHVISEPSCTSPYGILCHWLTCHRRNCMHFSIWHFTTPSFHEREVEQVIHVFSGVVHQNMWIFVIE